ncbi:hypothetical protein CFC21_013216 [Triticum aestivum]|uniref:Protein kinase domain-containing protein n=2 Tax=Triticum aestivum TaxID=4565 RepID=A0A3B6A0N6_WHEAT|nr:hypothetical protein CFC21_013216 [Triticum aestivum]
MVNSNSALKNGQPLTAVSAIMAIKLKYQVHKNWFGDPCGPETIMVWAKLACSYATARAPRIRRVDLSSRGLNGDISSSFANLKVIQYLNLSNNNLVGSIPDALSQLTSLAVLYGNNRDLCPNGNSCGLPNKRKSNLAIYIVVPIIVVIIVVVLLLLFCLLRRKRQGSMNNSVDPHNETTTSYVVGNDVHRDNSSLHRLESRQFTYEELKMITNNFQRVLGQGGFGYVYDGFLEDGTHVAVKLQSHSSSQGVKEFLAEEVNAMEDVYHGVKDSGLHLNLHKARIADFGLFKAFNGGDDYASTMTLVGTPGYVDPEYQATMQPTAKSDVYSFGVVLLELVTGKPAILQEATPINILHWTRKRMAQGHIESVVDARMCGIYDVNSVWKVVEIALKCIAYVSPQRPTMTGVVAQLQECMELEEGSIDH